MEDTDDRINFKAAKLRFQQAEAARNSAENTKKSSRITSSVSQQEVASKTSIDIVSPNTNGNMNSDVVDAAMVPCGNERSATSTNGHGDTQELKLTSSSSMSDLAPSQPPKAGSTQSFVVKNKRGDTSDLRWLTSVSGSFIKPGATGPSKENAKPAGTIWNDRATSLSFQGSNTEQRTTLASSNGANVDASVSSRKSWSPPKSEPTPVTSSSSFSVTFVKADPPGSSAAPTVQETKPSPKSTQDNTPASRPTLITPSQLTATVLKPTSQTSNTIKTEPSSSQVHKIDIRDGNDTPVTTVKSSLTVSLDTSIKNGKVLTTTGTEDKTTTQLQAKEHGSTVVPASSTPAGEVVTADDRIGKLYLAEKSSLSGTELGIQREDGEELAGERVTLKDWNPTKLMNELYRITLQDENMDSSNYLNMEGFMEKLPINKTKETILKTWKRRYFRARNGVLRYYETSTRDDEVGYFEMNGGKICDIGERMLGIEDGRGHYLVLRCLSEKEFGDWRRSLESQTVGNVQSTWVKPVLASPLHHNKKVVVIDLGSCSVRAGLLGEHPSLPTVFLPTVVATHRETGKRRLCLEALLPDVRASSTISYPVRPTLKVDKFAIDWDVIPDLFAHIFSQLDVDPSQHLIMLSVPSNLNDKMKEKFMDILVKRFKVSGVNLVSQTILSLYAYNASSGIVVNIGEHIEVLPITDGYVVETGVERQPYGGQKVTDSLNSSLTERRYRFFTDVEFQIVRLTMEKLCYVSEDYNADFERFQSDPDQFGSIISLDGYDLPHGTWKDVSNDLGRFQSPEGLFDTHIWGMDNKALPKLVQKAIQACPMDIRRQMWRNVYLSGGVTQLKGFASRLQVELSKLAPPSVVVQVHATPNRYHAAYIGACTLAGMAAFDTACITADHWNSDGPISLKKWRAY